jgi:NhaA family Na+:H+ antiporter
MSQNNNHNNTPQKGINHSVWEKTFNRVLTPFEEFIHRETTSGLLLMGMAILALILANSSLAETYLHILHTYISIGVGDWSLKMSLHHWINDALMAVFFFVVGLELKREIVVGELSNPRNAILPIAADCCRYWWNGCTCGYLRANQPRRRGC